MQFALRQLCDLRIAAQYRDEANGRGWARYHTRRSVLAAGLRIYRRVTVNFAGTP